MFGASYSMSILVEMPGAVRRRMGLFKIHGVRWECVSVLEAFHADGNTRPMAALRTTSTEQSERLRRLFSSVTFFSSIFLIGSCGYGVLALGNLEEEVMFALLACSGALLRKADRLSLPLTVLVTQMRLNMTLAARVQSMLGKRNPPAGVTIIMTIPVRMSHNRPTPAARRVVRVTTCQVYPGSRSGLCAFRYQPKQQSGAAK